MAIIELSKYRTITVDKQTLCYRAKRFGLSTKQAETLSDVLFTATVCEWSQRMCGGLICVDSVLDFAGEQTIVVLSIPPLEVFGMRLNKSETLKLIQQLSDGLVRHKGNNGTS